MISYAKESGREKYYYIMKTLVFTGIRISELKFLTVEAVAARRFTVGNKGKIREVFVLSKLASELYHFCETEHVYAGVIFKGNLQKPITRIVVY